MFQEHLLRNEKIEDEIAFHIVIDRSVQGVMNSFFLDIEAMVGRAFGDMEASLNDTPIGSRGFRFPSELLRERLQKLA